MTEEANALKKYADEHWQDFSDLWRFKTIAAQHLGIKETSDWLLQTFKQLGAKKVELWTDQGGNPVVFAEFTGNSDQTVLFYNHYDTQPADPVDQWDSDPFEPTVRDGKIFVRGAEDDKGELLFRLVLLKYYQEHGGLPVNAKFYVEGEEEIGSSHVVKYTQAHRDQLAADAVIWEGGAKNAAGQLSITGGLRGIACLKLSVATANADLHSSLASYAESAPWRLVKALNSLRSDSNNHIRVEGIYDDVTPLTDEEQKLVAKLSFDPQLISKNAGLTRPLLSQQPLVDLANEPTINIEGITAGYQEEGVKTVTPRYASAKLDFRLAPSQDPTRVRGLVQKQLAANGFPDIKVEYLVGQPGFRSDVNHPFVKLVCDTAQEVYVKDGYEYVLNSYGAGPAYAFGRLLKLPVLSIGLGYAGAHVHGANENIRLADAYQALEHLDLVLHRFA
ncbi:M20/M25/M40 family metallo-hydrolase [Limosilactobacillus secaliphilus]|uniref:M20 M25 M40 family peptidase n=1 Tax=Limosilactobacillus secaliphilus TaxID=396268 RepID=A0A0R2I0R0_9LACO|nr:M20/M25/M40 family metallo-hydrolase [Limosilactobacillus secaliphilus]KRN58334.1 M20 M25 M40 family peptidase [Limosilactobacillus secaliphilus]